MRSRVKDMLCMEHSRNRCIVTLSRLPVIGTVTLKFFDGTVLKKPECDELGTIIIPEEIASRINSLLGKYVNTDRYENFAIACALYEEREYPVPAGIESKRYVENAVKTLEGLNNYVRQLQFLRKAKPDHRFREWVLFGRYHVNRAAYVTTYQRKIDVPDVIPAFDSKFTGIEHWYFHLPKSGSECPFCKNEFTIEDVKNGNCIEDENTYEICHRNCPE